jgi:hypothetical protein
VHGNDPQQACITMEAYAKAEDRRFHPVAFRPDAAKMNGDPGLYQWSLILYFPTGGFSSAENLQYIHLHNET